MRTKKVLAKNAAAKRARETEVPANKAKEAVIWLKL